MTPEQLAEAREKKAAYDREYRRNNREKRKTLADQWRKTDQAKALYKRNYTKRKEREGIRDRLPAKPMTPEELREYRKQYWAKNKEVLSVKDKERRLKNLEKYLQRSRENYQKNKRYYIESNNRRAKSRRKVDIEFRLIECLRTRVGDYIRGHSKSLRTRELIGCSLTELQAHLEAQFESGMTWDNYGRNGWTIDHRTPLSHFKDMANVETQKLAFHFTNMSPKWGPENSRKGNRFAEAPLAELLSVPA